MKNFSILSAVTVFAMVVCGCSKQAAENAAVPSGMQVSFRGEYAPAADAGKTSRVAVDVSTGKTSWIAGDQCGVWIPGNSTDNVPFANTAEAPDTFSGTLDEGLVSADPAWACYPYSAGNSMLTTPARTMRIVLPTEQAQQGGQLGASSVLTAAGTFGYDINGNPAISAMRFVHQTAGVCFNVYGSLQAVSTNPETLQSVSLTFSNAVPTVIDVTDPTQVVTSYPTSATDATTMSVKVANAPAAIGYAKADGTKAYISIAGNAPCSVASITIETDQATYTKTFAAPKELAAAAGHIYTVNLDLNTCKVAKKYMIGVPGDHNGWDGSQGITGRTADFFSGMVSFNGNYKYKKGDTWYGNGGEPSTMYYNLSTAGPNFNITADCYVITNTYGAANATLIQKIQLPGTWNSFDLTTTAPTFTYDSDHDVWIATDVAMTAGDEFKVVFNGSWKNFMNRGRFDGAEVAPNAPIKLDVRTDTDPNNIKVGQTGTYDVILDLSTYGGTLLLKPVQAQ